MAERVPISYTQWEAWLALYHEKVLLIAKADETAPRGPAYAPTEDTRAAQQAHLARLAVVERFPGCTFKSLARRCFGAGSREQVENRCVGKSAWRDDREPRNLPFVSLGDLFKGREEALKMLRQSLTRSEGHATAVTGKALYGLGGIGKTRLAVEYALRHADDYSALLFVPAETPVQMNASLAALAGPDILDLPEKDAREDEIKIYAVYKRLAEHPGWLMIFDNVDGEEAAKAVEEILPKLTGGHVLITGRISNFSPAIEALPLDVLAEADAASLLLDGTPRRETAPNDETLAHELARELDGLALALAQAAAYINRQRIGFSRYLNLWKEKRGTVLNWFDSRLVSTNHDVGLAATWVTSVEKLTPAGRYLLELCAFLAPEPIPKFLLDVPLPSPFETLASQAPFDKLRAGSQGEGSLDRGPHPEVPAERASKDEEPASRNTPPENFDAHDALADLFAYSLATQVTAKEPSFTIHRLVQDYTRRSLEKAGRYRLLLVETLGWVNAAFIGDPQDVRSWPVLDPLAPHALAITKHAGEAGLADPTARLLNDLGILFYTKSRFAEAEPLMRRALQIEETSFGPEHANVAIRLNNLAQLLKATNRLAEVEPLMRRALAITETSFGPDHPDVAIRLNNLAQLLKASNRLTEAEPLIRRALAITETSFGPEHPNVAICLNNLAQLLQATHRLAEAEPLMRRALGIDEANFGPDHPNVAIRLNNLARLLQDTIRLAEAEPLYRRGLAIDEASFGPDHPEVAIDLNNLAGLLQETNRLAEAEPLMRRVIETFLSFTRKTGHEHPHLQLAFGNYERLLIAMGRSETEAKAEIKALIRAHGLTLKS